jgi:type II secretory ATPase GspE/PulE/Tfp pilus assembly ATPase PilB-like protein
MVGEIRDLETAEIAIKAALTGHLVFSTLHTNDAPSAFVRLVDIGVKPFLVASGVRAVLAQRLVRTICTACKETTTPDEVEMRRLCIEVEWDKVQLMHGAGCDNCHETGYTGRMGVYELLTMEDDLRGLILEGSSSIKLRRLARLNGMTTLREDAWKKALAGITTLEEVNRRTKADEPLNVDKPVGAVA